LFDTKLTEKNLYSDLVWSDGHISKGWSTGKRLSDRFEYFSGYDTSKELPKAKVVKAFALPTLVALLSTMFMIINNEKTGKKGECAAPEESDLKRNDLTKRAQILVNESNAPCEDRFNCHQFKNIDGFYMGVFDGHGGW